MVTAEELTALTNTIYDVINTVKAIKDSVDQHMEEAIGTNKINRNGRRYQGYFSYDDLYGKYTLIFGGFGDIYDKQIAIACLYKNNDEVKNSAEAYSKVATRFINAINDDPLSFKDFAYAKFLLGNIDNEPDESIES